VIDPQIGEGNIRAVGAVIGYEVPAIPCANAGTTTQHDVGIFQYAGRRHPFFSLFVAGNKEN
jgi:hypothetical protein